MKQVDEDRLELFRECARYIVEFEESDWQDCIWNEPDPEETKRVAKDHVFAKAMTALYGERQFTAHLKDYLEKINDVRPAVCNRG